MHVIRILCYEHVILGLLQLLCAATIFAADSTPSASHHTTHQWNLSPGVRADVWTPVTMYYTRRHTLEQAFMGYAIAWAMGAAGALWHIDQMCYNMPEQERSCDPRKAYTGVFGFGALSISAFLYAATKYGSDELRSRLDFVHQQTVCTHQDADTIPRIYDAHDARASVPRGINQIMQRTQAHDTTLPCTICHEDMQRSSSILERCKQYVYTTSQLDCGHTYHTSCIYQWMQQSHSCPLCRKATRYGIAHTS